MLRDRLLKDTARAVGVMFGLAISVVTIAQGVAEASSGGSAPKPAAHARPRSSVDALTQLLVSDMLEPSEKMPQGVPAWYDWAGHPRAQPITGGFRAFTAWGQLYQCAGTHSTAGETVQLRNIQTWVLYRGQRGWRRLQSSSAMGGAAFPENYVGSSVPGHYTASATGTSVHPVSGRNFHFWPSAGRVSFNASRVTAVTVSVEARLASRSNACLVLSVGGDMWRSLAAAPGGSASADVGIGRFKLVDKRWGLYTMTSGSPDLLQKVPPPAISASGTGY